MAYRIFCAKVGKLSACQGRLIMAELQQPENSADSPEQTNPTSTNVGSLNVGGNVGENVIVGNNNVFNYYPTVQKNVK